MLSSSSDKDESAGVLHRSAIILIQGRRREGRGDGGGRGRGGGGVDVHSSLAIKLQGHRWFSNVRIRKTTLFLELVLITQSLSISLNDKNVS